MQVVEFDKEVAGGAAISGAVRQAAETVERVRVQLDAAITLATQYAEHLEGGGDPLSFPPRFDGMTSYERIKRVKLVSAEDALEEVARHWTASRDSRNVFLPTEGRTSFEIGEYVSERVGEPITLETFRSKWRRDMTTSMEVAKRLVEFEKRSDDLVARRCKVKGKVAFVVRQRRNDDEVRELSMIRPSNIPEEA